MPHERTQKIGKNMIETNCKTLPIQVRYKDKIDLAYKLLNVYSVLVEPLTDRNISLLACILLEDINGDDFNEIVIRSNLGITNEGQLRTELSRLKDKGLLIKDPVINRKDLSPKLQKLANIINQNDKMAIFVSFSLV